MTPVVEHDIHTYTPIHTHTHTYTPYLLLQLFAVDNPTGEVVVEHHTLQSNTTQQHIDTPPYLLL